MNWFKLLKISIVAFTFTFHSANAMDVDENPSRKTPQIKVTEGDDGKLESITIYSSRLFMRNVSKEDLGRYFQMFTDTTAMAKYMHGVPRPAEEVIRRHTKYVGWWESGNPYTSYLTYLRKEEAERFVAEQENLMVPFMASLAKIPFDQIPFKHEVVDGLKTLLASLKTELETTGKIFIGHVLLEPGEDRKLSADGEVILPDAEVIPKDAEVILTDSEGSYVFLPAFWQRGYGTEAVGNIVELARLLQTKGMTLNGNHIDTLIATARPDNPGSCLVLERNGFSLLRKIGKFNALRHLYILELSDSSSSE